MMNTCKALYAYLYDRLFPTVETPGECRAIVLRLLSSYAGCDSLAVSLDKPLCGKIDKNILDAAVERLYAHEPVQYIIGEAYFMNRMFFVTPDVLIPRPETEEGIAHILQENKEGGLSILDIGTGSGCIAITLAGELPQAQVEGIDSSLAALRIAARNSSRWNVAVGWMQCDILTEELPPKKWDIFVSNPPYVTASEKKYMHPRVLNYEPWQAIFVPDEQPLLFYQRIIALAQDHLYPKGKLYLEINEQYAFEITALLASYDFSSVEVRKDLQGKDRWIKAVRL
jgi:release factor glutamine methyltransferase